MPSIQSMEAAVLAGQPLDDRDAAQLVALSDSDPYDLLHSANRIRRHFRGNEVRLCSIINARSGACSEDCAFCAQSARHKTGVPVYPLVSTDKIVETGRACAEAGAFCFGIVTSGRGPGVERDFESVRGAIDQLDGIQSCASLGTLTAESAARLKAAGLRRYNHNLETARSFFPSICSTHSYDDRRATVKIAKAAGLHACCGGIFGLGESWQHRIEMALDLRDLDADTIPINFLNPVPGTRLAGRPPLPPMEALRIIALYRFLLPAKDIKTSGGRERCLGDLQSWMFYAGANGTLIGNYLTTPGRPAEEDLKMIAALGMVAKKAEGGRRKAE